VPAKPTRPEFKAGDPCAVCGATNNDRAMIYRDEPYCSDNCRKVYQGEKVYQSETTAPGRDGPPGVAAGIMPGRPGVLPRRDPPARGSRRGGTA